MPIQGPLKPDLQSAIATAFQNAKNNGSLDNASSDAIIQALAREIADAIDRYSTGLVVTVTVQPGQTVATSSGAGTTTSPGIGKS
jgi:hypothetical protein